MRFMTLNIDLDENRAEIRNFEREGIFGVVDYALFLHSEIYKTYLYQAYNPRNVLVFGKGPFAGSILPGSHRLTFVFRSPLYGTLFPSTMGGAAYVFLKTGIDFVSIVGKAKLPSIIFIKGEGKNLSVGIHYIEEQKLKEIWKSYKKEEGVYAFTQFLIDNYKDFFKNCDFRIACVGPASMHTNFGAIFSQALRGNRRIEGSEDWAARGGSGSVMLRSHNVAAIIFGGNQKQNKFK